jgi:alpha-tubulin suppressor-like RCC1 family protein
MTVFRLAIVALLSATALGAQGPPPAGPGLIRHIAGRDFVLLVTADGSVVVWGSNADGLALRPRSEIAMVETPTTIELPAKARQTAMGNATAYALLEDGTIVAWGENAEGQLGSGPMRANLELGRHPKPSPRPVKVTGLSEVIQIGAGDRHAVALRQDGTVYAWGLRDHGEVGDGKPTGLRAVSALGPVRVPGLEDITQIAVGPTHNLALRQDGHVLAWGSNNDGELGNGTRNTGWTPTEVAGLDRVVWIAAGAGSMAKGVSGAVRDDGTVWMWGSNTSSQFGTGEGPLAPDDAGGRVLLPVIVKGATGAKRMSIGFGHVAALLRDGSLQMWGHDGWGQIGVGTSGFYQERPVKLTGISNVAAVYLGASHSFAVRADGTLWIWGPRFFPHAGILGKYLHVPTRLDLNNTENGAR